MLLQPLKDNSTQVKGITTPLKRITTNFWTTCYYTIQFVTAPLKGVSTQLKYVTTPFFKSFYLTVQFFATSLKGATTPLEDVAII